MARLRVCLRAEKGWSIDGHFERKSFVMILNHGVPKIYPKKAHWTLMSLKIDDPSVYVAGGNDLWLHMETVGHVR
jgi:hypothetical protein